MEELKRGKSRVRLESSRVNDYAFELFRTHCQAFFPALVFCIALMYSVLF
jgi:hypothetical protein